MDVDGNLVFAILRMEVRRAVIVVQHIDHDPKESRDFGHVLSSPIVWSNELTNCDLCGGMDADAEIVL